MLRNFLLAGYRLIIIQLILLGITAGVFAFVSGWHSSVSALLGGSAWIIPNLYFIRKLFKPKAKRTPQTMANDFFWGEGIKLLLSAGLIIIILLTFTIKVWGVLSGYVAAIATSFLLPLLYKTKKQ